MYDHRYPDTKISKACIKVQDCQAVQNLQDLPDILQGRQDPQKLQDSQM